MEQTQILPVIMCGGAGTRLWPVSRETLPKQFAPILGDTSTFQQALMRVSASPLFARPVVVTGSDFRFIVAEQIRACGATADIVLEPVRRDSAAAVAVAAGLAARQHPERIVAVLAADQIVAPDDAFESACRAAIDAARDGRIVVFGVPATAPATGYGYIRPGAALANGPVREVEAFVEKPDAATATRYMREGCLWNSGNFLFRADVMQDEVRRLQPELAEAAERAIEGIRDDIGFGRLDHAAFAAAPRISIDYAVMEHTDRAAVLPVGFRWSDIGTWDAVRDVAQKDGDGNAVSGSVELVGTRNCLVRSEDAITTAVVGCEDIVVVATGDAVLVASRRDAGNVKAVVERLHAANRREAVEHRRVYRPWGFYQGVDASDRHQVKRIVVKCGGALSLQRHHHRAEHWVVVKGTAEVTLGDEIRIVHENQSIYIPTGCIHRLSNPGKIPLELIEVQVGSYLGEDDIVRLEDVYNRAGVPHGAGT